MIVACVLIIHAAMLAWIAYRYAPMYDEMAHLPSGISHWMLGRFDLYRVNPPLPRMVAALPVLLADPQVDWAGISNDPYSRSEFSVSTAFSKINGERSPWLFTLGRWACIPFSLWAGWVCYRWAARLFGFGAGLVALVMWCFCPNVLAWGATVMPDVPAAAMGVTAGYCFWRWLREPTWPNAALAGLTLGLVELVKTTWIVLFALWPVLWLLTRLVGRPKDASPKRGPEMRQLAAIMLGAVYIINLGYGFEGSFRPLGDFEFISTAMTGQQHRRAAGNRFRDTILASVPVPLPANYLRGIDVQKYDFEVGKWSYLRGEQKQGGWYYYYVYALAVKTPTGTLCLAILAIVVPFALSRFRGSWRDEIVLLLPAVAVLVLVSSQTGFNRYFRYVLPALPFLFVSISRVGIALEQGPRLVQSATTVLLASTVLGSVFVYPHSMSFFNLLAGGPQNGHAHLLDANIDWGQDLLYLRKWLDEHPEARPFHLQYFGSFAPALAGIDALPVPPGTSRDRPSPELQTIGPQPGWFAVSINDLAGYRHFNVSREEFAYFRKLRPIASAGYSIYIYHVTLEEANALRRELGLPELEAVGASEK